MLSNPRGLRGMSSIMTMKAWTEKINSSADIPAVFKDHFYGLNKISVSALTSIFSSSSNRVLGSSMIWSYWGRKVGLFRMISW